MTSRKLKKNIRVKVTEVTIKSSLCLFQYNRKGGSTSAATIEVSSEGGSTGSEVSVKLQFPDGVPGDDMNQIILRQKWELDHTLLEMEHARGSLTGDDFAQRVSSLEDEYLQLLDEDEEEYEEEED